MGRQRGGARRDPAREAWQELAAAQAGVVSRRQLLQLGLTEGAVSALLDSRRWVGLLPGVYATFTGPVPPIARAWAAVLYASTSGEAGPLDGLDGAVLGGTAALWLAGLLDAAPATWTVCVPAHRYVRQQPSVVVHRRRHLATDRHPVALPPRLRLEAALLDETASARTVERVVDLVLRATQRRLTTPERLRAALAARKRHPWRHLVLDLLADAHDGVASPLERRWARDVERRHGLPRAERNAADPARPGRATRYRDLRYRPWAVVVELDGREAHPDHERFRDRERDNEVAVDGEVTLRYGMREVASDACGCAAQCVAVLRARGWLGTPRPCGPTCPVR